MSGSATLKRVVREGVKHASKLADKLSPPPTGLTFLIYHRVGHGAGGQMDISPPTFTAQMDYLANNGRVISLDTALKELAGGEALVPGHVLTFDDGTDDWAEIVAPVLVDRQLPATFYVATEFIDQQQPFAHGGRPISWSGLRELRDSGIATIGSHTHRHLLLDRLPPAEIAEELDTSIDRLSAELQISVDHFCYPKAVPPSVVADRAVRSRFSSATLAGTRTNQLGSDPFSLSRSPIQAADQFKWFHLKAHGGLGLEDRSRQRLNQFRYRNERA
ncbi:MAG TPA: hypothetical protein DEG43_08110 [Acidimicrobiaceae bacterium]|nr:hypothetical protein [Acidimicrobiaceae bacterium]